MIFISWSIFGPDSGFAIKTAGFKFVPTFFVTNLPDLDASCIHRVLSSPSDAALTAAFSSLSAVDRDTTWCFFVHTFRQCPPLMIAPADTDRRVALSPPFQSASEYASTLPLCCQRNQHVAFGLPARYLPILLTRSESRTDGLAIAHYAIDANMRSGRSHKCSVHRDVTSCECLTVFSPSLCHLYSVPSVLVTHVVPIVLGFSLSLALSPSSSPQRRESRCGSPVPSV